jgi:serine-type D-Ala-D-Ala carboxypeptidase (penicillin-binding protein 5/6)
VTAPAETEVKAARPDPTPVPELAMPTGVAPLLARPAVDITAAPAPAPEISPPEAGPPEAGAPDRPAPDTAEVQAIPLPSVTGDRSADSLPTSHGRPHRRVRRILALALTVVLVTAGLVAAWRINRPLDPPSVVSSLPTSFLVPGTAPSLPWPAVGQGAVAVPALGYAHQSGPELPVPIASLTKMANAVVILRDHPLAPGQAGPAITITQDDASQYDVDLDNDESSIPIDAGETLTEQQMLEGLLNQSANDIAYSLAVWDAGSETAFVAKMNALAASVGATQTHYADASGFDPQSVSTAADCLRIAAAGMSIPAFAQLVGLATVTLPLVGTVHNIVTEIGANGVVGVKSGYTSQAGGCMVLAGYRTIEGRTVLVLAAALGQMVPPPVAPTPKPGSPAPPAKDSTAPSTSTAPTTSTTTTPVNSLEIEYPLLYAGPIVEKLLDASEAAVVPVAVARPGQAVLVAGSTWSGRTHQVNGVTERRAALLAWPGQRVISALRPRAIAPGAAARSEAGQALYALGTQIEAVPVKLTATLPEPSWWWRLVHG